MFRKLHEESVDHSDLELALYSRGYTEFVKGCNKRSLEWYEASLHMLYSIHGKDADHKELALTLQGLGRAAMDNGCYGDARKI